MRPTLACVFLFGAGIFLAVILVLADAGLWPFCLAYFGFALVALGSDAVLALPARRLAVRVVPPGLLYIGDRDELEIVLLPGGGQGRARVEALCDVGPILERPPPVDVSVEAGIEAVVTVPLVPLRRGTAEILRLWLRWHGPLGLIEKRRVVLVAAEIPVVPNTRAVRNAAVLFFARDAAFGLKTQSQRGEGSEFESLRDYVPGLDHRAIDWKHSARHRSLLCKEFRSERNHPIVLAFDTGQLMSEPLDGVPRLDHAVNAGLLLAYTSMRYGDRIGIFGFDSEVRLASDPVGGSQNFWRIQQASARLDYRHEETNFTLGLTNLLGRLNRRSLVILQTEFVDTVTAGLMVENLGRLAARHLVLFVTLQDPALRAVFDAPPVTYPDMARAAIADDFMRERQIVFERLRRMGIQCLDAPSGRLGVDLVNRYLLIARRELV